MVNFIRKLFSTTIITFLKSTFKEKSMNSSDESTLQSESTSEKSTKEYYKNNSNMKNTNINRNICYLQRILTKKYLRNFN